LLTEQRFCILADLHRITYNPQLATPEALGPIKPPVLETCT
jgi:hypothetical protein